MTICISVLSIGLSCVYAGSRTLTALAETGYAPKIFAYVDKSSRPLFSVIAGLCLAPLAYINLADNGEVVFNWLVALSGLSTLFSWLSICLCQCVFKSFRNSYHCGLTKHFLFSIRFRAAWKKQGHSLEELPFRAMGGVYGSWFGVILIIIVFIANFYIAVWPIGGTEGPADTAESFFRTSFLHHHFQFFVC